MKKIRKSKINCYDVIGQISQFPLKFVWRHWWRHSLAEKFIDIIFLKTIMLKVTKMLDPKHQNAIKSTK